MANGYLTFLDYFEMRRRIERRLASGRLFFLHIILFAIGAGIIGNAAYSPYYYVGRDYFIYPFTGHWVSLWSGILLVHGLWSFWQSGARGGRREAVIEHEMRQRVQDDALYLSQRPKTLFRLHGLLSDDIRKRYSGIPIMLTIVFLNALIWIPWTVTGQAFTSFAWQTALVLVIPFISLVLFNGWRRAGHEKRLRQQLATFLDENDDEEVDTYDREMRLGDDGELVTVEDYMLKQKRKRA
ncbi:MAG: hypothetical protein LCI00_33515 [Chloroflexi bacterium]|nr:hypothetical protein [Chloroflexota bacterium]MCC6897064.1 hypothetical protein [Anaerolineae bacterium]